MNDAWNIIVVDSSKCYLYPYYTLKKRKAYNFPF